MRRTINRVLIRQPRFSLWICSVFQNKTVCHCSWNRTAIHPPQLSLQRSCLRLRCQTSVSKLRMCRYCAPVKHARPCCLGKKQLSGSCPPSPPLLTHGPHSRLYHTPKVTERVILRLADFGC